jgi:hypothetical protein
MHEVRVDTATARLVVIAALVMVGFDEPAQAYIDPGAGGMLTQLLLGSVAAGLVMLRVYWQRVTARFRRTRPDGESAPPRA